MLKVTETMALDEAELKEDFIHASGPGGQNVNKVATAVQLRFDLASSPSLSEPVRARLIRIAGRKVNSQGVLVIEAKRFRTREQNRQDARDRLAELIRLALVRPKPRRSSGPPRSSRRKRLEEKRRRSLVKSYRQRVEKE